MNMKTMFNAKISLLLSLFLSISFVNISAMEEDVPTAPAPTPISKADQAVLREVEQSFDELNGEINAEELARYAQEIEQSLKQDEQNEVRGRNRVLWSIPAAFPADKFDENVKDLHVNIPLYGKVSLGENFYKWYKGKLAVAKKAYGVEGPVESFVSDVHEMHGQFNAGLASGDQAFESAGAAASTSKRNPLGPLEQVFRGTAVKLDGTHIRGVYAPGAEYYSFLTGKNLIGLGLYRSDLNEIGFLAANIGSEYILFKDIRRAKLEKVKEFIIANKDLFIDAIEKVQASAEDRKAHQKAKRELRQFIIKNCSLFKYNPLKKEVVLPVIKYLIIQRVIERIRSATPPTLHSQQDQMHAFVKNREGELVTSGVTPISIVTLSKLFVAPIAAFSETSKKTVYQSVMNLKFTDRLCSSFSLPSCCYSKNESKNGLPRNFYWLLASIAGESLVLVMAIKIIDNFLNTQLINSLSTKPDELLVVLKENALVSELANPNAEEREQMIACDQKLEMAIERAFSLNKTSFKNWIAAKRSTFTRIGLAGFCCIVLPSLAIKAAPFAKNSIKSLFRR